MLTPAGHFPYAPASFDIEYTQASVLGHAETPETGLIFPTV